MENNNEIQQQPRRRGRPKLYDPKTYDEAMEILNRRSNTNLQTARLTQFVKRDIRRGVAESVVRERIASDFYETGLKPNKGQVQKYLDQAYKMIKTDWDNNIGWMKEKLTASLYDIVDEARAKGDRTAAINALDKIAKMCGAYDAPQKVEVKQETIGEIKIDFGLSKNNDDEDVELLDNATEDND